jgi:peptidoglycan/xylan/chitin deacetylase (PgdA/CDA1 family)
MGKTLSRAAIPRRRRGYLLPSQRGTNERQGGTPMDRMSGRRGRVVATLIFMGASMLGTGVVLTPAVASAGTPQAAFYTYQAPGGGSTAGKRVIALTFDDGPGPYTARVLSVLQRYHVPATFFEVGYEVAATPQLTRMVYDAGYPVQNHTWDHADLAQLPVSQYPHQIDQTQQAITAVTGEAPNCVRPPYDAFNSTTLDQLRRRGLTTMSYSIDSSDYRRPGVGAIVNNVVGAAFPGAVAGLHDGGGDRSQTVAALPAIITGLEARGYSFVSVCGTADLPPPPPKPQTSAVYGFGSANGSTIAVTSTPPFTGMAADGTGGSYRLTAADGGVFSFNGAGYYGSVPGLGITPAQPVVGIAPTADGKGYWQVGADGGVFTFGDAAYYGSMGGTRLNSPVVGITPSADGLGYWEVAADGGVFAFGDAAFLGSMGGSILNRPIVGITATAGGGGYWLVASDGGVFSYGDARFSGSMGGTPLNSPVVGLAADRTTGGYWMVGADGGVFSFDAPFLGSRGGSAGPDTFFAVSATDNGAGYLLAAQHDA